jgi:hypothetical protein
VILSKLDTVVDFSNEYIRKRIKNHLAFVEDRVKKKGKIKHKNRHYGFPVVTQQETELILDLLKLNPPSLFRMKISLKKSESSTGRPKPQPEQAHRPRLDEYMNYVVSKK